MGTFKQKYYEDNARKLLDDGKHKDDFNHTEGLERLIKIDKDGQFIYYAGLEWPEFEYRKGQEALERVKRKMIFTSTAGENWKQFDYNRGSDFIMRNDVEETGGYWTVRCGTKWPNFNYKKGLEYLKKYEDKYYYREALRDWPKSKETIEKETSEIKNSPMLPTKKLSLKEWLKEARK
jgi:hypothetical protein